eukprot:s693_g2.t1
MAEASNLCVYAFRGSEEVTNDPEVQRLVYEGEALIKEGKELCQQGDRARAYDKFYAGLQYLLKVMPALGEGADSKPALALKAKIHGYLDETEKLKAELDSGEAIIQGLLYL